MKPEQQPQLACPRCSGRVSAGAGVCPGCGLTLEPGVAFFEAPRESAAAVEAAPGSGYEHRSVSCLPMDLERVARAEAVDGWQLVDSTADPQDAGAVRAHFRRPLRTVTAGTSATPAATARSPERARAGSRSAPSAAPSERSKAARRPSFGPEPKPVAPAVQRVLYFLLVMGVILVMADAFGIVGLVLGLIFVPGVLRSLLGRDGKSRR